MEQWWQIAPLVLCKTLRSHLSFCTEKKFDKANYNFYLSPILKNIEEQSVLTITYYISRLNIYSLHCFVSSFSFNLCRHLDWFQFIRIPAAVLWDSCHIPPDRCQQAWDAFFWNRNLDERCLFLATFSITFFYSGRTAKVKAVGFILYLIPTIAFYIFYNIHLTSAMCAGWPSNLWKVCRCCWCRCLRSTQTFSGIFWLNLNFWCRL